MILFVWTSISDSPQPKSIEEKEEEFNNVVREYIINLLTFIVLYVCAYVVLARFQQKKERDGLSDEDVDAKAYRISFYLCTFTLAVSMGSVFMLPMSMIGNEVVHLFPKSYWVQWLNGALIHTFWKWIFFLSNLSLFVLLPFSYFFTESEGFSGQRRGLMPRVYETIAVLLLLAVLVFGLAVLALAFFDNDDSAQGLVLLVGEYYLQYLYSFLLCLCMLLITTGCAPLGFLILFEAVGQVLVKPKLFEKNDDRISAVKLEEDAARQKLKSLVYTSRLTSSKRQSLQSELENTRKIRLKLERRKKASALERNLGYPLVMLLLLALTGLALFLVSFHILKLIFIGDNELHPSTVADSFRKDYRNIYHEKVCEKPNISEKQDRTSTYWWRWWVTENQIEAKDSDPCKLPPSKSHVQSLGADSLSSFGIFGTILEVLVIIYLTIASVVGLYNLPGFRMLRPEVSETTMTKIIMNCLMMQLVSSALPVLSRVLGITDFELQGNFGNFYWLGNFYVVFGFNFVFAVVTALCLVNKMTKKVRRELIKALRFKFLPSIDISNLRFGNPVTSNGISNSPHPRSQSQGSPQKSPRLDASKVVIPKSEIEKTLEHLHEATSELIDNIKNNGAPSPSNVRTPNCSPSRNAALTKRNSSLTFPEIGCES